MTLVPGILSNGGTGVNSGTKQLKINSAVSFTFHGMKKLTIKSGANSIKWHYSLNTNVQQTIGGEVTQILSSYVGPMIIEGLAPDRVELSRIRDWFVEYMEHAGTTWQAGGQSHWFRDETAVGFLYPARGWSFKIQPTDFEGFRLDKSVYAIPWRLTAEIVADNALNYLEGVTMTAFTGSLSGAFVNVGYSDPTGYGKASRFVNPLWDSNISQLASTMGNNFQRLVANWNVGNFANFAYGSLTSAIENPDLRSVNAAYKAAFGANTLSTGSVQTAGGEGAGTGTYTYQGAANPTSTSSIVADIASQFSAKNVPAQLGVAVALQETGGSLDPDSRNPNDGGPGIDGVGLFQTHYGGRVSSPAVLAASETDRTDPVTKNYPSGQQIIDAAAWFAAADHTGLTDTGNVEQMAQWAQNAQGSANIYYSNGHSTATFRAHWSTAAGLITQYANLTANSTVATGSSGSISGFAYYSQYDPQWANVAYGSSTVAVSGCGVTSMAMVVSNLSGRTVSPATIASNFGQYYKSGVGSSWSLFSAVAQTYNLNCTQLSTGTAGLNQAATLLGQGSLMVACGTGTNPFTGDGHILVIRAASQGGFYLADPNTNSPTDSNNTTLFSTKNLIDAGLQGLFAISK